MTSLASYLIIGLIAAAATAGSMPFVIRIAKRQGWMATPDERRMHPVPTPDVGGIGMFVGILAEIMHEETWRQPQFAARQTVT